MRLFFNGSTEKKRRQSGKIIKITVEIMRLMWYNSFVCDVMPFIGREWIMGKKNDMRKKAIVFQSVVGIVCLLMLGFAAVWAGRNAIKGFSDSEPEPEPVLAPDSSVTDSQESTAVGTAESEPGMITISSAETLDASSAPDDTALDTEDSSQEEIDPAKAAELSAAAQQAASYTGWQTESTQDNGEPAQTFPTAADITDDFSDAVFIGNSLTVGLGMNSGKPLASFFASTGLNVNTVWDSDTIRLDDGSYGTVFDGLSKKQFSRVYVMFGINELGWPYKEVFRDNYIKVVEKIKELQPSARIYIESVLPVSPEAVNTDPVFTTENVDAFNEYVKEVASGTGSTYLDVNSVLRQEDGSLPTEASTDGIHLIKDYCMVWLKYLADNK